MAKQGIQWGSQRFQGNTQPNWYPDLTTADRGGDGNVANNVIYTRPNHPLAGENLEATDRGWERVVSYTDSSGQARTKREVVVAQGGLANTFAYGTDTTATQLSAGAPQIVDIRWRDANTASDSEIAYAAGATEIGVVVTYSEPVFVTATGGIPQLTVTGSSAGALTLKVSSGNGTNQLTFSSPGTPTTLTQSETLTMADSKTFIAISSGTIHGLADGTGYGRKSGALTANTPAKNTSRVANVSSLGIASAETGAGLTLAVDAGRKQVKPT